MKAEELRIGNLFNCNMYGDILVYTVKALSVKQVQAKENSEKVPYDWAEPIPLTQEWLKRFGFEDNRIKHKHNPYNDVDTIICVYRGNMQQVGFAMWRGFSNGIPNDQIKYDGIEHVHQLQNLYHALTGEELTLKDNE